MKQVHTKTVANQTSGHSVEGQTGSCINPLGRPLHTRLTFVSCDGLTHRDEFNMIFCTTLTDQILFNFKLCEGVEYSKIVFLLGCLLQCQCANSKKSVHCRCFLLILIDIWYTYIYIFIYSIYIYHHHTHIQHIPNLMILQPHWTCWWFQGRNLWNLWPWHWLCHLPSGAKAQMVGMHPRKLTWNLKMMGF